MRPDLKHNEAPTPIILYLPSNLVQNSTTRSEIDSTISLLKNKMDNEDLLIFTGSLRKHDESEVSIKKLRLFRDEQKKKREEEKKKNPPKLNKLFKKFKIMFKNSDSIKYRYP